MCRTWIDDACHVPQRHVVVLRELLHEVVVVSGEERHAPHGVAEVGQHGRRDRGPVEGGGAWGAGKKENNGFGHGNIDGI